MPTLRNFLEKINIAAEIAYEEPLSLHTSFRIGGPAEALVAPRRAEDLAILLHAAQAEGLPITILGGGANVLVGDRGIRGLVLDTRLLRRSAHSPLVLGSSGGKACADAPLLLRAEAGLSMDRLCEEAQGLGLGGLETFYGMPGSVGGSVFMNARCYELEIADRLAAVEYLSPGGERRRLGIEAGEWSYKRSPFQAGGRAEGGIVIAAEFALRAGDGAQIAAVMAEKKADREAKGHYRLPSAGSVFKNDRRIGRPTGKILDELGLRGRRLGGALISEWHANIFVNAGGATAAEMRGLIEFAKEEAKRKLGIELEPEIVFLGQF